MRRMADVGMSQLADSEIALRHMHLIDQAILAAALAKRARPVMSCIAKSEISGHDSMVVRPALIPKRAGERVKTTGVMRVGALPLLRCAYRTRVIEGSALRISHEGY
jgi:hypothetical protein